MNQRRISILLQQPRQLFHTRDLALLWGISNNNTLLTTIKRYVKAGILQRIHKGFYATVPVESIDPEKLGIGSLHCYAYVSTETVLAQHGIIFQPPQFITIVSEVSRHFSIKETAYRSRQLKDDFLYNETGITETDGIKKATRERGVADMLYFNPKYHFDNREAIDWQKVETIQQSIGYR